MNSKEEIKIPASLILFGNSEYRINKPIRLSAQFVTVPFEDVEANRLLMLSLSFTNITKIEFLDMDQNSGVAFVFHFNDFMMQKVRASLAANGLKAKKIVPQMRQISSRLSIVSATAQEEKVLMFDFPDFQPEQLPRLRAILLEAAKVYHQCTNPNQNLLLGLTPACAQYVVKLPCAKWVMVLDKFGKKWTMEDRIISGGGGDGRKIIFRVGRTFEPQQKQSAANANIPGTSTQQIQNSLPLPASNRFSDGGASTSSNNGLSSNPAGSNIVILNTAKGPTKKIKTEPSIADSEEDNRQMGANVKNEEGADEAIPSTSNDEESGGGKKKRRVTKNRQTAEEDEDWEPVPSSPPARKTRGGRWPRGCFRLELLRSELARLANEFGLKLVERKQSGSFALMTMNPAESHNYITLSDDGGQSSQVEVAEYRDCEQTTVDQWEKGSAKQFVLTVRGKCLEFFRRVEL